MFLLSSAPLRHTAKVNKLGSHPLRLLPATSHCLPSASHSGQRMDTYFLLVSLCLSTTPYVSLSIFLPLLWHQTLNCNTLYKMLLCRMKLKTKWFCVSIYSMCAYVWMCIMKKLGESDKDFHSYFPSLFFVSLHWSSPVMTQPLPRVRASVSLCVKTVECMRACVLSFACLLVPCILYILFSVTVGYDFSALSLRLKKEKGRENEKEK